MIPLFRKLRWLKQRCSKEEELQEEIQFHLDEEVDELQANGLTGEDARQAARRRLGNVTFVKEGTRATWSWPFLEQLAQDLRYALRTMFGNRTFTALAALSLALGIGANTAIYSFMDAILLRLLPVPDPASLVVLNWRCKYFDWSAGAREKASAFVMHSMSGSTYRDVETGVTSGIFPYPAFDLFRKNSGSVFSSVFAYCPAGNLNVMVKGQAERASGEYISGDYFRGLAVAPSAGRLIVSDDDRAGAPPVVVLTFGFSQRRFGNASLAVGQTIRINNVPFTISGVTPPEFFGVDPAANPDFYVPLHTNLLLDIGPWGATPQQYLDQNYYWLEMMGRIRPDVGRVQAQANLAPLFHRWVAGTATNEPERANLPALRIAEGAGGLENLRRRYSKPLYLLMSMVGLILGIACANTANLLLARASARRREMAVRLSLGAGRLRVVRQLLTESVLLACLGGLLGIVFAFWGIRFLAVLLANGKPDFPIHAELNWHVLGVTLALSVLSGMLFGLAPALQSTRVDIIPALKETRASKPHLRTRCTFFRVNVSHLLVISQISISLLMLVAAGLFVRTLSNLQSIPLGFNRQNILLFELNAQQAGHRYPEIAGFYADLQKRFSAIPGVRHASLAHSSLIGAGRQLKISVSGVLAPATRILGTGPRFFSTMQIPLLLGREIDGRDQPGSPPVAVVNELFAKTYFPHENPIGRQITLGGSPPRNMQIVGVSADAHYGDLKSNVPPVVYIPYNQGAFPPVEQMTFILRTTGDALAYIKPVREIVRHADSRIPVTEVKTQAAEIDQSINQEILFARLCTGFAILALAIACVGLYGTTAYAVARRTSEIGIRMALGAQPTAVVWMIIHEVLILATVGLAIGAPAALGMSTLVKSFLFGVKANDPQALLLALAILLAAALLAGYVPARKASRIDPLIALRHE